MIDADGYRPNVGIILANHLGHVFWGRRLGQSSWQFPQGGINRSESPQQAMYRELREEVGLRADQVRVVGWTRGWLRYRLPNQLIRHRSAPLCIGQKQVWFALRLCASDRCVDLECTDKPEFDDWQWVQYWYPLDEVVFFKRQVYERALTELAPLVFANCGLVGGARETSAQPDYAGSAEVHPAGNSGATRDRRRASRASVPDTALVRYGQDPVNDGRYHAP